MQHDLQFFDVNIVACMVDTVQVHVVAYNACWVHQCVMRPVMLLLEPSMFLLFGSYENESKVCKENERLKKCTPKVCLPAAVPGGRLYNVDMPQPTRVPAVQS